MNTKRLAVGILFLASALSVPSRAQGLLYHLEDPSPDADLGSTVARLGDIDHDGVPDFAVQGYNQVTHLGSVSVYSGADATLLYTITGDAEYAYGCLVSDCGDIDRDGTSDFLVAGIWGSGSGSVALLSGTNGSKLLEWSGDDPEDDFGLAVAGAGDLDGDGVPDVIIGAPQYTPTPPPVPPGYARAYSGATGAQLFHWSGTPPGQMFGYTVDGAGDVNGDGRSDVAIGTDHGSVDIYSGLDGSLLRSFNVESWPWSISAGNDLNGDGVPDIVAGTANWSSIPGSEGRVTAWSGADGSLLSAAQGTSEWDFLGAQVDVLDDVDGDGLPDILASAYNYGPIGGDRGVVLVFPGLGGPPCISVQGLAEQNYLGLQAGSLAALGDLTGDGRPEFGAGGGGYVQVYTVIPQAPTRYCTAKTNSQGCTPLTSWSGTPSLSGPDDYVLRCDLVVNGALGVLVWSGSPAANPFLGGTLCIGSPRSVAGAAFSGGSSSGHDCSGVLVIQLSQDDLIQGGMLAGMGLFSQFFYRDRLHPDGSGAGLSEGVSCTVLP